MQESYNGILTDIPGLERHVAAQPASPLFARLASAYINANRPTQALKVCLQGLRYHPGYPTGLLLTARAQVMLRQYSDARQSLRELLRILPVCPAAQALMERMKELELQYPPFTAVAGSSFAETPVERIGEREEKWSRKEDILPGFEVRRRESETIAESDPANEPLPSTGGTLDLAGLASRLETARIPALPEEDMQEEVEEAGHAEIEEVNLEGRPVTETLIMIYVQQGKLREAIDAYRRLAAVNENRRAEFEEKISQLELQLQQQRQNENPT
ncbi:tetratricopeptide repeat protein [bacterium]|nr:tetratricopeptide repeat protein [bacterium]